MTAFVVLGNGADPRIALFQSALVRAARPPAEVVDYRDLLARPERLRAAWQADRVLRIESPGRSRDLLAAILSRGGLDSVEAERLVRDRGRLLPSIAFYRGLCRLMQQVDECAATDSVATPAPADVPVMFDKAATHARFRAAGLNVPRTLGGPAGFEDLMERMRASRLARVFVKLRYGSAASGAVALATSPFGVKAWTTAELVEDGEPRIYNSRRTRVITGADLRRLVDALAPHALHVEAWIPKAGIGGRVVDLRVLVIAGEVRHIVLRRSRGTMTNLHLLNERGAADALRARMPPRAWEAMLESCRSAAMLFPQTLTVALDVAVAVDFRSHVLLEANAFGDLLKGVLHEGRDPYDEQIRSLQAWLEASTR